MGVRHHSLLQSSYPSVHALQPPWSTVPLALIQPCEVQARAKGSVPPSCTRGPDVHLRLSCCRRWIWWVSRYHVTSKPISHSENVKDLKKELNLCHDDLPKGESGLFCDVTMNEGAALECHRGAFFLWVRSFSNPALKMGTTWKL